MLVTGPTGSGKTTTLAAMIDHINENQARHIVTIEDPIEVLHPDKRSIVNQREIGTDTDDFHNALKRVLRQDPDVILIGEMRDPETVWTALSAAETGSPRALDAAHDRRDRDDQPHHRLLPAVPAAAGADVGRDVAARASCPSGSSSAPTSDGRVPAVEVLVVDRPRVRQDRRRRRRPTRSRRSSPTASTTACRPSTRACATSTSRAVVTRRDALATASNAHDLRLMLDHLDLSRAQQDLEGEPPPTA